jgi:hypothetical protein
MHRRDAAVGLARRPRAWLWVVGLLCFGVGDVVTTSAGLHAAHVTEVGPLVRPVVERYHLPGLLALKVAVFGVCYLLYRLLPSPQDTGVPLGLATFGTAVVCWNLFVLYGPVVSPPL